jgi:hypothetical protein
VSVGRLAVETGEIELYPNQEIFFLGGKTSPPMKWIPPTNNYNANKGLRIAICTILAVLSLFTLIMLMFMYANINVKVIKASSPLFLSL